jgi:effector-binding domain-containing protein
MSEIDVRIVKLEPMQVASAYGFGEEPEYIAWGKLLDWAGRQGIQVPTTATSSG